MQMRDDPGMGIDQDSATSSNVATDQGDHHPPTLDEDFSTLLDPSLHADDGVIGSGPLSGRFPRYPRSTAGRTVEKRKPRLMTSRCSARTGIFRIFIWTLHKSPVF